MPSHRTVIRLVPLKERTYLVELDEVPPRATEWPHPRVVVGTLDDRDAVFRDLEHCPEPGAVTRAGELLFKAVAPSGSVLQEAMQWVFSLPGLGGGGPSTYPIFFELEGGGSEGLPWEALYHPGSARFVALDPDVRWPVGRLPSSTLRERVLCRVIEPRLKITLLLAAAGVDTYPEWQGVRAALPLDALLQVVVSDGDVEERIRSDVAATPELAARVVVARVPEANRFKDLEGSILAFAPNVLHVFCHGWAGDRPQLAVETHADWVDGHGESGLRLDAAALATIARLDSLWLAILNCCQGGTPARGGGSLASSLVRMGVPAVVAMADSVDARDAMTFSAALHTALAEVLTPLHAAHRQSLESGQRQWVDEGMLAREVSRARLALRDAGLRRVREDHPQRAEITCDPSGACREWTYPILCAHRGGLELVPRPPMRPLAPQDAARLRSTLYTLRALYASQSASIGTPPVLLTTLEASIRDVELQLYEPVAPHIRLLPLD